MYAMNAATSIASLAGGPLLVKFAAGSVGDWRVDAVEGVAGESLPATPRLAIIEGAPDDGVPDAAWTLRGVAGHARYAGGQEVRTLGERQSGLGRRDARRAALIPIRKSPAWWALAQDERRAIFEEKSRHIGLSLPYLPAIARRLHHARDLGERFDFLTWFEYAPADAPAFADLLGLLRRTEEWTYVEREVDVRLSRD